MAKWSRPPAASLIAFSSLSPFITHNFIKIPPHLSLPLSPLLLPSLSLSPHHNHRVSVFLRGSSGLDKLHYLHFDVFLSPPSLPPSLRPRPAALGSSSESSVVVFHVFYLISCVFRSRCGGTPSVTVTLTRSFAQVQSHFGKILHMSKSSRVKPFVFHLRENEPKNVMNI